MQDTASTVDRLLKAGELARKLNCGKSTVYRLAQTGKIPAIAIGETGVRFDLEAVLRALRRK
jgi:excisionase family DNA binding protein